jgi:hypothetical protein
MISVSSTQPKALLDAIYKAIRDKHVMTWRYATFDGVTYLTHCPDQWDSKAWLKPSIVGGELRFSIIAPKGETITWVVYGVYQGRLIEMLNSHFASLFTTATATAYPQAGEVIKAAG